MTPAEVAEWLQEMWANSPIPDSGEQSYRYLRSRVERVVNERREELIGGLRVWLSLRSEPKTMLAADLAADFHLTELRPDLFRLLEDVQAGRTNFPSEQRTEYGVLITDCLGRI